MKKFYESPETELMFVQFEQNIMSELAPSKPNMAVETWDEWDS